MDRIGGLCAGWRGARLSLMDRSARQDCLEEVIGPASVVFFEVISPARVVFFEVISPARVVFFEVIDLASVVFLKERRA
jgi:hypothetical protein